MFGQYTDSPCLKRVHGYRIVSAIRACTPLLIGGVQRGLWLKKKTKKTPRIRQTLRLELVPPPNETVKKKETKDKKSHLLPHMSWSQYDELVPPYLLIAWLPKTMALSVTEI
jgi:hypothetical protein